MSNPETEVHESLSARPVGNQREGYFVDNVYVASFKEHALKLFSSSEVKRRIEALNNPKEGKEIAGELTRIFNEMDTQSIDYYTFKDAYNREGNNPSVLLNETLMQIEDFFLNEQKDGLGNVFIEAIGEDEYEALALKAKNQGTNIANLFMQAVLADYGMCLSKQSLSGQARDDQKKASELQEIKLAHEERVIFTIIDNLLNPDHNFSENRKQAIPYNYKNDAQLSKAMGSVYYSEQEQKPLLDLLAVRCNIKAGREEDDLTGREESFYDIINRSDGESLEATCENIDKLGLGKAVTVVAINDDAYIQSMKDIVQCNKISVYVNEKLEFNEQVNLPLQIFTEGYEAGNKKEYVPLPAMESSANVPGNKDCQMQCNKEASYEKSNSQSNREQASKRITMGQELCGFAMKYPVPAGVLVGVLVAAAVLITVGTMGVGGVGVAAGVVGAAGAIAASTGISSGVAIGAGAALAGVVGAGLTGGAIGGGISLAAKGDSSGLTFFSSKEKGEQSDISQPLPDHVCDSF